MVGALFAAPASAGGDFVDTEGSVFEEAIDWMADEGITKGCNPPTNDNYCPDDEVTREVMAAWIARAWDLPESTTDHFTDDDNSIFEGSINSVADAAITLGCNPPANTLFCPKDTVDRGQLAALFSRIYNLTDDGGGDHFDDDNGSVFESAIDRLYTAGITKGCNPPANNNYCPDAPVTRGAAAAFFFRAEADIDLQILSINDFHGNIATTNDFLGVGRADYLAANIRTAEAGVDNSIVVSAGDLIGASPLISALFHDEPTIEAMNLIGLDINGVGNHEFDEGSLELLRMQNGGSHPVDGNLDGDGFEGADFDFLAANVVVTATGETVFPSYTVEWYEGVPVAFIGMTLEGTPSIVTPEGVAGLTFKDEVETVNALVPSLQAMGIEAIVVLMHEGGFASEGGGEGDGCGTLSGNLYDIVVGLDDAVDVVIGGHNNQRFVCLDVDGKAVTMAYHSGRMFTDIDVSLDRFTRDMTVKSIDNKWNFQDGVTPAPDLTALIDKYDTLSGPLANTVIGSITTDITEDESAAGESALGDVIADAQLAATESAGTGNAVIAFMNPGGIRADLTFAQSGAEGDGNVTYGEAFTTQPFGNSLVTMTLTGQQIVDLLTQQWVGQTSPRILQVSDGFEYTWDAGEADADKVVVGSIMVNSVALDLGADYRITVNSFLAAGGDNFSVLVDGTNRLGGEIDLDALVTYFGANSPVPPGAQDRISVIPA
jgi:5'-nucleotidase